MPRGNPVPVMGVWLKRIGDHAVVDVEFADGNSAEAIRERLDGQFSHNISEHGLSTIRQKVSPIVYEAPRNPHEVLRVRGVGRVADEPRSFSVALTKRPTDDELRDFHNYIRAWRFDARRAQEP